MVSKKFCTRWSTTKIKKSLIKLIDYNEKNILIVDDDKRLRELLKDYLTEKIYKFIKVKISMKQKKFYLLFCLI